MIFDSVVCPHCGAKKLDPVQELASLISEISEEYHCAGWQSGIEFDIWQALHCDPPPFHECMLPRERMLQLSEQIGGWLHWPHEYPVDEKMPRFVPLDEWLQILARARTARFLDKELAISATVAPLDAVVHGLFCRRCGTTWKGGSACPQCGPPLTSTGTTEPSKAADDDSSGSDST